jgi:hypothetical protein
MATRSSITLKTKNGKYKTIYCHWDGNPTHHIKILKEAYNEYEYVEKLLELGNLSVLDKSMECPDGHTFDNSVPGHCIAYGRDRGEENQEAREYETFEKAMTREEQEYNYLYTDKWSYTK